MKFYILLLIALSGASSLGQNIDNSTLDCSLRGSCYGGRRNRLDMTMDWSEVNCMCDTDCIEYGDCCPTAQSYDSEKMRDAVNNYDCVAVFYTPSYYMKGSCASTWTDIALEDLCMKAQISTLEDPLLTTPATSISSGVTYRNYYCAVCNDEQESDLHSWEVMVTCPKEVDPSYLKENLLYRNDSWGVWQEMHGENVFQVCEVYPKPKDTVQHMIRQCKNYVSTCASNWTDSETEGHCSNYTMLVYGPLEMRDSTIGLGYFGSSTYRNRHCAQCNYIENDQLACNERDFRLVPYPTPVSFSVLFDFGPKETICENGYLWDSFFRKCRLVRCIGDNYEYQSGRCVRISEEPDLVETFNETQSDALECERIFFDKSEYTEGINGSIIVVPYRKAYKESEYELTDEGVFVCTEQGFTNLMGWLTLVGIGLSCVCLVLHMIAFVIVSDLRNLSGKNLICLCLALLTGYTSFLVVTFRGSAKGDCKILAYTMYYGFMASFTWMNVMAYDVWRTLRLATSQLRLSSGQQWRKFILYSLYGWILPFLLMGCVFFFDNYPTNVSLSFLPEMGDRFCWFGQPNAILVYFVCPLVVIMTMNLIFFSRAVRFIQVTTKSTTQISSHRPQQTQLKLYTRLALLMGLGWIFGVAAGYAQIEYLWYIFILVNAFQGVFILLAFTCTEKVYKELDAIWKRGSRSLNKSVKRQTLDSQDSNTSQMNTYTSRLSSCTSPLKQ